MSTTNQPEPPGTLERATIAAATPAADDTGRDSPTPEGGSRERAGTDEREPLGRLVHEVRLAAEADRAAAEGRQRFSLGDWGDRSEHQRELDMRIGEAIAARERDRAEAAEARLAEVREVITTYFTVHGNNTSASLVMARDLAEAVRQVLDRVPLGTQERSGGKEGDRG